jgi:hypothetical protein
MSLALIRAPALAKFARARAARTISFAVIAGLDPAIHLTGGTLALAAGRPSCRLTRQSMRSRHSLIRRGLLIHYGLGVLHLRMDHRVKPSGGDRAGGDDAENPPLLNSPYREFAVIV